MTAQDSRASLGTMVSLSDVSVRYASESRSVVDRFSLEVQKGEFVILLGGSGSGKTSIFRLLTGEVEPASGKVRIGSNQLPFKRRRDLQRYRQHLGCVFQDFKLLEEKSVEENIAFPLRLEGRLNASRLRERVEQVLSRFGLTQLKDLLPARLARGEQQRVAIARAVAQEPLVLLADEPTAQLDERHTETILSLLCSENARGMTVILGTYDPALAARIPSSRVVNLAAR